MYCIYHRAEHWALTWFLISQWKLKKKCETFPPENWHCHTVDRFLCPWCPSDPASLCYCLLKQIGPRGGARLEVIHKTLMTQRKRSCSTSTGKRRHQSSPWSQTGQGGWSQVWWPGSGPWGLWEDTACKNIELLLREISTRDVMLLQTRQQAKGGGPEARWPQGTTDWSLGCEMSFLCGVKTWWWAGCRSPEETVEVLVRDQSLHKQ